MKPHTSRKQRRNEAGGVAIVVVLMLLVLLTISAIAMSRNALRESIVLGFMRQGSDVRNVADSGLEWSLYWMDERMIDNRPQPEAGAKALRDLALKLSNDVSLQGTPHPLPAKADMVQNAGGTPERQFDFSVIRMGKFTPAYTSMAPQGVTEGLTGYSAIFPDLWSVRANGSLVYPHGGPTFRHSREVWSTQPPRGAVGTNN